MPQILIRSVHIVQNHAQLGTVDYLGAKLHMRPPERSVEVK